MVMAVRLLLRMAPKPRQRNLMLRAPVGWTILPVSGYCSHISGEESRVPATRMSLLINVRPKDSHLHQLVVVLCMVILVAQRAVNVLVPILLGMLVKELGQGKMPYKEIALYLVCRGLQGGQGALGAARAILWIPVSQNLYRRLSCAAFEHVLGLSMDFHLSKRIGEVTSALSRGSSMNTFLESFLFQVVPMILDILFAAIYFFIAFNAFYTVIVLTIMWSYIFLTIYLAKFRARQRRDMAMKSREMDAARFVYSPNDLISLYLTYAGLTRSWHMKLFSTTALSSLRRADSKNKLRFTRGPRESCTGH